MVSFSLIRRFVFLVIYGIFMVDLSIVRLCIGRISTTNNHRGWVQSIFFGEGGGGCRHLCIERVVNVGFCRGLRLNLWNLHL